MLEVKYFVAQLKHDTHTYILKPLEILATSLLRGGIYNNKRTTDRPEDDTCLCLLSILKSVETPRRWKCVERKRSRRIRLRGINSFIHPSSSCRKNYLKIVSFDNNFHWLVIFVSFGFLYLDFVVAFNTAVIQQRDLVKFKKQKSLTLLPLVIRIWSKSVVMYCGGL